MHRILLVAEEGTVRSLVRDTLEKWGYAVDEAANSHESVDLFGRLPIDLVIVDLGMPDPDGVGTIAGIRELSEIVPIIAVSDSPMALEDALAMGVNYTLQKPFDSGKLWVALRWLLGRRRV
jgi:two-component system KDP operon response regulator KdpE